MLSQIILKLNEIIELLKEYEENQKKDYCESCRYWDKEAEKGCKSPCIEKKKYEEQQKQTEKSCKDCKHGIDGMLNFKSGRCEACYYDERLGGNCLFEEKQTEEKTDKSCDDCHFADLQPHEFPCCACSQAYMSRWELRKGAEE